MLQAIVCRCKAEVFGWKVDIADRGKWHVQRRQGSSLFFQRLLADVSRGISCEAQVNSMCVASSAKRAAPGPACIRLSQPWREAMMLGICGLPAESMQASLTPSHPSPTLSRRLSRSALRVGELIRAHRVWRRSGVILAMVAMACHGCGSKAYTTSVDASSSPADFEAGHRHSSTMRRVVPSFLEVLLTLMALLFLKPVSPGQGTSGRPGR